MRTVEPSINLGSQNVFVKIPEVTFMSRTCRIASISNQSVSTDDTIYWFLFCFVLFCFLLQELTTLPTMASTPLSSLSTNPNGPHIVEIFINSTEEGSRRHPPQKIWHDIFVPGAEESEFFKNLPEGVVDVRRAKAPRAFQQQILAGSFQVRTQRVFS